MRNSRCAELPGAAAVLVRTDKRFLIFGELHGTAETPALFADFVCMAASAQPIVVGLELATDQQPSLDRYLASDGSPAAQIELQAAAHWAGGRDGRASVAMFALVERLRALRASGLPLRLVAFVPTDVTDLSSQTPYEKAMAGNWRKALGGSTQARFIALVGNIHSMRRPFDDFEPAAMHMPPRSLLTFGFAPVGGKAWNCQQGGCGPYSSGLAIVSLPRGLSVPLVWDRKAVDNDYWYAPGKPFTPSEPIGGSQATP